MAVTAELNIVPGLNTVRMLQVHDHHFWYPLNSARAMKDASRKIKCSASDYSDEVQPQPILSNSHFICIAPVKGDVCCGTGRGRGLSSKSSRDSRGY
ncbi:BQ2448_6553 [Microbotryum intermedium]|uniref:BQ2448_6553 protein n=1 Tax=Microbotryum intermedium TaxID=269621 RepID=A0A238FPJ2_9BASI|nr:BQ2448_6553 [Microbotryum intermedium]